MFCTPEYTQNVSMRISKVLDEIGVNDITVLKRRRTVLMEECLDTTAAQLCGTDVTLFNFGSRTEGTTTPGLNADSDTLVCNNGFNIIQDLREWRCGFINLLMVRDENTPSGYCLLQKTYENIPQPVHYLPSEHFFRDKRRRVLMKNTWFVPDIPDGCTKHGPAQTKLGEPGFADDDKVHAYFCKSWPHEAIPWLHREGVGNWPSKEMKRSAVRTDGCFVVPVGRRGYADEELQWRISTSLTERKLMFSLNITQIRCYVLMKMFLKSYPNLDSEIALSSFICKTIVLHCIEKTPAGTWRENNLLTCFHLCLVILYRCVRFEHCPHFIIPENNLMAGRISPDMKPYVLSVILHFILSNGRALLEIETDNLGMRLSGQFVQILGCVMTEIRVPSALDIYVDISGHLLHNFVLELSAHHRDLLLTVPHNETATVVQIFIDWMETLVGIHFEGDKYEQSASKLLMPFLCTSLASVLASYNMSLNKILPAEVLDWFPERLATHISNKLKLVSVYYCTEDIVRAEHVLRNIQEQYNLDSLQSVCGCYQDRSVTTESFSRVCAAGNLENAIHNTAFCVRYLPCEVNCIPEELKHELFRSECGTHLSRGIHDDWMDWAAVDSLPLFYFLQYKVYSIFGEQARQQRAFNNLRRTIDTDPNLGHRETAFNLLGQCMEQEGRLDEALHCYTESSNIRPVHNAANSHTSQVLQKIHAGL